MEAIRKYRIEKAIKQQIDDSWQKILIKPRYIFLDEYWHENEVAEILEKHLSINLETIERVALVETGIRAVLPYVESNVIMRTQKPTLRVGQLYEIFVKYSSTNSKQIISQNQ